MDSEMSGTIGSNGMLTLALTGVKVVTKKKSNTFVAGYFWEAGAI